jgi:hypothetical protein
VYRHCSSSAESVRTGWPHQSFMPKIEWKKFEKKLLGWLVLWLDGDVT